MATLVVFISLSPPMKSFYELPTSLKLEVGEEIGLDLKLPPYVLSKCHVEIRADTEELLVLKDKEDAFLTSFQGALTPLLSKPGEANLKLKLFGLIPIKSIDVDIVARKKLVPGGHAIGILLKASGVTVTGFYPIKDQQGKSYLPARDAGLRIGDIIETIEGVKVSTDAETAGIIHQLGGQGKSVNLIVQRGGSTLQINAHPVLCRATKRYRLGLNIRDSAAGVGTMTFYDPETKVYGALGHVIADMAVNREIAAGQGKIVNASVEGIQKALRGQPGEKIGVFETAQGNFGDIRKNTNHGIFGFLESPLQNDLYREPLPVAFGEKVQVGPAEILTVIKGRKIEKFSVEIIKVNPQNLPNGKNLVVNITDPRLLDQTGGIIQGMSGSPIIQNGYLVGAVTHVLVNEPARGYGILAEWMLMEATMNRLVNSA